MGIKDILKEVISDIKPSDKELGTMKGITKNFSDILSGEIKNAGIKARVFIGGSLVKNTIIKNKGDSIQEHINT